MLNKYGLARRIREPVKREVRQRCGFCCVVCGNIFCQYHHFEEEYVDVEEHDPSKIFLLCGSCHTDVTAKTGSKRLSDETLRKYIQLPYGIEYSRNNWRNRNNIKGIKIGRFLFLETKIAIRIEGHEILSFCIAGDRFPIVAINAHLYDIEQKEILTIEENIISGNTDVWDFYTRANTIQINRKPKDICLRVIFHENGIIEVDRMKLCYGECFIEVKSDKSLICSVGGKIQAMLEEAVIVGADVGIDVRSGTISFGRHERAVYGKGKSRIDNTRLGKFKGSERVEQQLEATHQWLSQPVGGSPRVDFDGEINGSKVTFKNNYFDDGITPLKVGIDSLSVGVCEDN